MIYLFIYYSK